MSSPVLLTLPMPEERREAYIVLRARDSSEVMTVIEVLSPANKRPGGDGRREYLTKREHILQTRTHLVELDLLRGGAKLPMIEPLPECDYFAFVCRGDDRRRAEVYAWRLRDPLPPVPVPLAAGESDAVIDLESAVFTVYEQAGYDDSLDYARPLRCPLAPDDEAWLRARLPG